MGADIAALCREAALHAIKRSIQTAARDLHESAPSVGHVTAEDFDRVLSKMYGSCRRGLVVDVNKTGWNDIGGLDSIKQVRHHALISAHRPPTALTLPAGNRN